MCGRTVNVEECFRICFGVGEGGWLTVVFCFFCFLSCYNHFFHFPIFVTSRIYFFALIFLSVSFSHYTIGFSSTSLINPQLFLFLSPFQSDAFLFNLGSFLRIVQLIFQALFLCFHSFISQCKCVFR